MMKLILSCALAGMLCAPAFGKNDLPKGVQTLTTTSDLTKDLAKGQLKLSKGASKAAQVYTLQPQTRFQEIDGFGAAVTGSTCYNLMQMAPADRTRFLTETFSPTKGYGYSYIRVSIGCSDFSLSEYTCCDTPGIEHFALQMEEKDYVIPILKEILALNPSIKILGSPWTCPKWMKVNNLDERLPYDSWTSGQLNPAYYADYATYFVKWIQAFQQAGIPIYSITPQNEPLNRKNSASLFMGWEEERDFVKTALGPALKKAGLQTKIYAFDHNYNYDNLPHQQGYPTRIFEDKEAAGYFAGTAFHNYGGRRSELLNVQKQNPEKELVFTETSIGTWNAGRDLKRRLLPDMEDVALGTIINWCRGSIVWNLMLDNDRGPWRELGCKTCYGAVDIDNKDYKTITRNSHYYIMAQMAYAVKPGAVRIATDGGQERGIMYAAFENPDGTYAFVYSNNTREAQSISVAEGGRHFDYTVPAQAVVSFRWAK